jgi:hypothetical protein
MREAKDWPPSLIEVIMSVSILLLSHTHINARRETLPLTVYVIKLVKIPSFDFVFLLNITEMI